MKTLADMAQALPELYKERPFIKYRKEDKWEPISGEEALNRIYNIAAALNSFGLKKGDKIGLISDTRYEWSLVDFGMMIIGLISVPIYPSLTGNEQAELLVHSESKFIFIADKHLLNKIPNDKDKLSKIEKYVLFDGEPEKSNNITTLSELEKEGKDIIDQKGKEHIDQIAKSITEDDLASILYTSGTTGEPKGVMLDHRNFVTNAVESYERLRLQPYSDSLVFLPLSHAYARTCNYNMISGGISLSYAENLGTLGRDMIETKPDFLVGVPRVYEKIYSRIESSANKSGGLKKSIFNWAKKVALKVGRIKNDRKRVPFFLKLQKGIANALVYKKIKEKTGGNLTFVQSGSSALPKHIAFFFNGIGIYPLEGYGLTEASPIVSSNNIYDNRIGTVGLPLESTEVKLGDENELLVKGPNVMKGYYKNEQATKATMTDDGWLKTGDVAQIDDEGYIKIVDRKKDLMKTSGGKYIAPQKIENIAKLNSFIEEFVVIGENRKFASAIILPDLEQLQNYAKENEIDFENNKQLVDNKKIKTLFRKILEEEINSNLAQYESVKKFILIHEPLTIEKGEITPTMKVKRNVITEKYKEEIENLYSHS
jgi:long-chain acyl-CoA synthetase